MRTYLYSLAVFLTVFSQHSLAQFSSDSLTGTWKVTLQSRNRTWTETVQLKQQGDQLQGKMTVSDGSNGALSGTVGARVIRLERDTGLDTMQRFELRRSDGRLTGNFWNEGRVSDQGTATFERINSVEPDLSSGPKFGSALRGNGPVEQIAGDWRVTLKGRSSTWRETVHLQQEGNRVRGTMTTPDGSNGNLEGAYDGRTLTLTRETGRSTTQRFELVRSAYGLQGRFWNEGRITDNGDAQFEPVSSATTPTTPTETTGGYFDWNIRPGESWETSTGSAGGWEDWGDEGDWGQVAGTWRLTMQGRGGSTTQTVNLEQQGNQVRGTMTTPDQSNGQVSGSYDGSTLTLVRETGRETTQHFELTRNESRLDGRFWNTGRWEDDGYARMEPTGGTWAYSTVNSVTGAWEIRMKGPSATWNETLQLKQSGQRVTGTMSTSDGTRGKVEGTFDGTTLQLQRDTGRSTIQRLQLTPFRSGFRGRYWNEGRYPDQGEARMRRQ